MTDKETTNGSQGGGQEMALREKREVQQQEGTREGLYFEPAVDIQENETELTLIADVPGTGSEDIQVDLRDSLLTLTGTARAVEARWRPLYQEYPEGHFLRQFRLGQQIDQSRISAEMKDGVLTLTLPKAQSAIAKRIQVQTA
ncbi:MAG: Hsp20/alpha crystallin family protein [Gemmatimonadetes bacterium]|nr:Hsp20/alpha crystallin family protein [Gemmatimonadota bacterium]